MTTTQTTTNQLKKEYQSLKLQLINPGNEYTIEEVVWNDGIYEAIENLFKGVPKSTIELIRLNHI